MPDLDAEPPPVVWSSIAERQAEEICDEKRRLGWIVAWRWLFRFLPRVRALSTLWRRGSVIDGLDRPTIAQLFVDNLRVIYRIDPERVVILTVRLAREPRDELLDRT